MHARQSCAFGASAVGTYGERAHAPCVRSAAVFFFTPNKRDGRYTYMFSSSERRGIRERARLLPLPRCDENGCQGWLDRVIRALRRSPGDRFFVAIASCLPTTSERDDLASVRASGAQHVRCPGRRRPCWSFVRYKRRDTMIRARSRRPTA